MAKILIAEDEPDIRNLIQLTLQMAGHEVTVVKNGEEAVDTAPDLLPDMILLDVRMPRLTGPEACVKLKEIPELAKTIIVYLSAEGQDFEIQDRIELGAMDYIKKPFAPDNLMQQVGEILTKYGS